MNDFNVERALKAAVRKAISDMGIARFKQTSFFASAASKAAKIKTEVKVDKKAA